MSKRRVMIIALVIGMVFPRAHVHAQEDTIIGWLYIERLKMAEPLYESEIGTDGFHIIPDDYAVHLSGTAWLDTTYADLLIAGGSIATDADDYPAGRIVLAGHNPGVFGAIDGLQVGDALYLAHWPLVVRFEVVGATIVSVQDTSWLAPVADSRLLLTACVGEKRLIIDAVRVG